MNEEKLKQSQDAERYLKDHVNDLFRRFANLEVFQPDQATVSLFMAGSPGAGKTEMSKRLIERFASKPVRIDADEIREMFPGYNGTNANIFQRAATLGVNKLYDFVLEKKLNVILDGTFAYFGADTNVKRSLDHGRVVEIFYLFQDPEVAWDVTKKREAIEHRNVSKETFIDAFLKSQENIRLTMQQFSGSVNLYVVIKDFTKNLEIIHPRVAEIDKYLPKIYTKDQLNLMLLQ